MDAERLMLSAAPWEEPRYLEGSSRSDLDEPTRLISEVALILVDLSD